MDISTPEKNSTPPTTSPRSSFAEEIREQRERARREAAPDWFGGPEAFRSLTFERFDPAINDTHRFLEVVKSFDWRRKNLLMIGPNGVGKTFLATAKAHEVFDLGGNVRVFTKSTFSRFCRREGRDWLAEFRALDLIVWDDLENRPNSDSLLTCLQLGIDDRRNWGKPGGIIATSSWFRAR